MKFLMLCLLTSSLSVEAMDKLFRNSSKEDKERASSPRSKEEKKDEKEKARTPRHDKDKHARDSLAFARTDKKSPEIPPSRATKSASPASHSASPLRASTVGKRGSLDWTTALKESKQHAQIDESYKKWSGNDEVEDSLKKLFLEFSIADDRRKAEIYCTVMRIAVVSATKEAMASNFFEVSHKMAALALYNIPSYYTTNIEEGRREIQTFWTALYNAKEAFVNKLSAEAPKRNKWQCEQVAITDVKSPIVQLLAQYNGLKVKYPHLLPHTKDLDVDLFTLPEQKKS